MLKARAYSYLGAFSAGCALLLVARRQMGRSPRRRPQPQYLLRLPLPEQRISARNGSPTKRPRRRIGHFAMSTTVFIGLTADQQSQLV